MDQKSRIEKAVEYLKTLRCSCGSSFTIVALGVHENSNKAEAILRCIACGSIHSEDLTLDK